MKIFLVIHHEIMGVPGNYRDDEMMFYTTRNLNKALELIKKSHVSEWSWWEIQTSNIDDPEWPEHIGYFGRRGGKISNPPYDKCVRIFESNNENQKNKKQ